MFYLYRTTMNLSQIDEWLQQLKEKHMERLIERIAPFAKHMVFSYLLETIEEHTKEGIKSPFNIDASVVIYIDASKLYLQFFGVDDDLYEKEINEGLLADFRYYDNADMPENVSQREWYKRSKVADRILSKDDSNAPSRCGFYRVLTDEQDCMRVASYVRKYLEDKEGIERTSK